MSHDCEHCNRGLVHWNSSTLKAQWNSATNKLIASSTPREITVTLSGFTDCECTFFDGSYYKATGIGVAVNGDWVVPQYPADPLGACIFWKRFIGTFGKSERWNAAGCSGAADETRNHGSLEIQATLTATGIDFFITVADDMLFDGTITYASGESCADTSEVATIVHACFGAPGGPEWFYPCGTTGTVSVSL